MNPLFSKSSLMILESLSFTKTLYAFDFDGTLSRIVKRPSDAVMSKVTAHLFRELSALAPIAIVSGRSLADLKKRLIFRPPYLVGNHGLEGLGATAESLDSARRACQAWNAKLSAKLFGKGVEIEDKDYSLAIHYRRSRNKREVRSQLQELARSLDPRPRLIGGKSVVNFMPEGAPHKGAAVMELARRLDAKSIFYLGDDDTDEDVFSLNEASIMSVRVGKKESSNARYFIERQSQINALLRILVQFHQPRTPKPTRGQEWAR